MAHSGPRRRRTGAWTLASILLLVAVLGTLIVPIYARTTPMLGSFPFFYWYQLVWVPVVAILSGLAYLLIKRPAPDGGQAGPAPAQGDGDAR